MKKIASLLLIFMLVMAGCGQETVLDEHGHEIDPETGEHIHAEDEAEHLDEHGCIINEYTGEVEPVKVSMYDGEIDPAIDLLKAVDLVPMQMQLDESVTAQELEQYRAELSKNHSTSEVNDLLEVFYGEENLENDTLTMLPERFYPTIYHEGVEIDGVQMRETTYHEAHSEMNKLEMLVFIDVEHEELRFFERTYVFEQIDGEWVFQEYDAFSVAEGEVCTPTMLPIAEGAEDDEQSAESQTEAESGSESVA